MGKQLKASEPEQLIPASQRDKNGNEEGTLAVLPMPSQPDAS